MVDWDHEFVGREALARQRDGGLAKRLVSFAFEGRTIPRHGYAVRLGPSSGTVASGNFSPSLGVGVGMAYLAPDPGKGDGDVEVEIRGTWQRAARTTPPFLER